MFQFKYEDRRQEKPYFYRLRLEWMGRAVELGVSLKDISLLMETGKLIATQPKQIGKHIRSLREKWKDNGSAPITTKTKRVVRKEETIAADA
jgi:sigma54-dependent transcription regulator